MITYLRFTLVCIETYARDCTKTINDVCVDSTYVNNT